jgi:hypothetical protein
MAAAPHGAAVGAALGAMVPGLDATGIPELIGGGLGGLVAGTGAAWTAHKAQSALADELAPDSIFGSKLEQLQATEHPLASGLGGLVVMGRPNPVNIIRAAKTLASQEGRAALKTLVVKGAAGLKDNPEMLQQARNVVNVAQGGAINAAFKLSDQIRSGKYSAADLMESILEGTLFNEPWLRRATPAAGATPPKTPPGTLSPAAVPVEDADHSAIPVDLPGAHDLLAGGQLKPNEPANEPVPISANPDDELPGKSSATASAPAEIAQPSVAPPSSPEDLSRPVTMGDLKNMMANLKASLSNPFKPDNEPTEQAAPRPVVSGESETSPPSFSAGEKPPAGIARDQVQNVAAGLNHDFPRATKKTLISGDNNFYSDRFQNIGMSGADDSQSIPFDPIKLVELQSRLQAQRVKFIVGEAGAQLAASADAEALYLPGEEAGQPGTIVWGSNPSRTAVIEEVIHYGQHKALGFRKLSRSDIIQLEIEAQSRLLQQGLRSKWTQREISDIQKAKAYWEGQQP